MPRLIETETRTDAVVGAINDLLVRAGPTSLSMRAIAGRSGVSTSSLLHHYGSREHMMRVACARTVKAWIRDIDLRRRFEGVAAFLPADPTGLPETHAWLGWCEFARTDRTLGRFVPDAQYSQKMLLQLTMGSHTTDDEAELAVALVRGLLVALCLPKSPMSLERARLLLVTRLGLQGDSVA